MTRQKIRQVKSILIFFFYLKGIGHKFLSQSQRMKLDHYFNVFSRLREDIRRKRPEFGSDQDWMLHYDNGPALSSYFTQQIF